MKEAEKILWNERLRQERIRHNWRQQDLADQLGTTVISVKRWERGRQLPGSYFRQKLCALFEKSAEELGFVSEDGSSAEETAVESPQGEHGASSPEEEITLWNVPFPRNPFFTGREEVLAELHRLLAHTSTVAALAQSYALSGLGGIGKTHLAVEYAYRYRHTYQGVFWVQAETQTTLVASFVALAESLRLPERTEQDQNKVVAAVLRWLNHHQGWLLIFDNVEDLSLLKSFLPATDQGALLLTTRLQSVGTLAQAVEVSTMTQQEGIDFLLARTKRHRGRQEEGAALDPQEEAAIRAIVTEMGRLPLALEQAGAYIAVTQCSFSDYLHLFQTVPQRLLDAHEPSSDHPLSVVKTFELAFEQLEQQHPIAAELLTVCAFLAPEAIPDLFFLEGAPYLGPTLEMLATDRLKFHEAIKALLSYSLLQRHATEHTVTVHRLVQVVLKGRLSATELHTWERRIVEAMSQLFPFDEFTQAHYWQVGEQLLPHAQVALAVSEQWDKDQTLVLPLMNHVATYLHRHAQYTQAEQLFERSLRVGEYALGPKHPSVAEALHGLADISLDRGLYARAELLFQQAIQIREQTLGVGHPQVAISLDKLGVVYWEQGQYEQAEQMYQQALHIWEQTQDSDHPQAALLLNNLGTIYQEQGKYEQAEPLFQQALHIWEQALGPDHPRVASPLNNLGNLYNSQGRYEQAESLFQRSLHIWEQTLGPDHPLVALSLTNLGDLYYDQGRYKHAIPLHQRAIRIWEQALGPDHCQLALPFHNLGDLYVKQGRYEQAEPMYRRALHILKQAHGPDHPHIAYPLNGLGNLYLEQTNYKQAESFYQQALTIRQKHLGQHHPEVAETLHDLARLRQAQQQNAEALSLYQQALAIREQALGAQHPRTEETRSAYTQLLREMGHEEEAAADAQRPAIES